MKRINNKTPIVAIGAANAFPLLAPAYFLDNYAIACIKRRKDLDLIKKDFKVFCLEEDDTKNSAISRANPGELLKIDSTQEFIRGFGSPLLFARKTTPGVQKYSQENRLTLLSNQKYIRDVYENKFLFRKTLEDCGIKPIPGTVFDFDKITWADVEKEKGVYGEKVVLQAAELVYGGGVGTAFIKTKDEFDHYMERMKKIKYEASVPRNIEHIILTKFMNGLSSSILGVATKHGVITGPVQTQLQDIGDVCFLGKGSGIYCGHDWSYKRYPKDIVLKAKKIAETFGEYIYSNGYKGIFGLDLLIDDEKNEVYPVECNSRYTDALPVMSLIADKEGIESLEYYHFLELMGEDYEVNVSEISEKYMGGISGSQILIMSKFNGPSMNYGELEAGIYKFENGKINFVKNSYSVSDIKSENEFLLTDGVPYKFTHFKRIARIMRAVFPSSVLAEEKKLKPEIREIVSQIYNELDLREDV